jgi:hypothetical protein
VKLQLGENEFRFHEQYNTPFPLYPGEELITKPTQLIMAD